MLKKRGFTLIELLVVIAIIGVLATIVMVSLSGAKSKSRDAKRQADIKSIQLALSLYYNDNGMYPKNIYSTSGSAPSNGLAPTYLPVVPRDPQSTTACTDSSGQYCYKYMAFASAGACHVSNSPPSMYHVGAAMEETAGTALLNDVDAPSTGGVFAGLSACTGHYASFDGNATACSGTSAATPDSCFDMTP